MQDDVRGGILIFLSEKAPALPSTTREDFLREALRHFETQLGRPLQLANAGSRPSLAVGEGYLSLSHTRHWIGIAYGSTPLGFDLEEKERRLLNPEAILRRFFSTQDVLALGANPSNEKLLRLWTRKEALLKIEGRGIHEEIGEHGTLSLTEAERKWQVFDLAEHAEFPKELVGALATQPGSATGASTLTVTRRTISRIGA